MVEYMYVLFLTAKGKTYGCFAFDKSSIDNGEVKVGFSFCNPTDSKKFSKKTARENCLKRLQEEPCYLFLDYQPLIGYDYDNETLANLFWKKNLPWLFDSNDDSDNFVSIPVWVQKCVYRRAYLYTLASDNSSLSTLVEKLDVSHYLFEDLLK